MKGHTSISICTIIIAIVISLVSLQLLSLGSYMFAIEGPATNRGHRNPPRHIPDFEKKTIFLSEARLAPLLAVASALVMSEFESEHIQKS